MRTENATPDLPAWQLRRPRSQVNCVTNGFRLAVTQMVILIDGCPNNTQPGERLIDVIVRGPAPSKPANSVTRSIS
ncbi:MAG TPA: hypothetical protein VNH18_29710 [Bryobacteraceae bacterium]|nr:hypothetical protein [Bryobacteraceae bacterium]